MSVITSPLFVHRADWVGAGCSQGEPSCARSSSPLVVRALPATVAAAGVGLRTGWAASVGGGREAQPAGVGAAAREALAGVGLQGAAALVPAQAAVAPTGYAGRSVQRQPAVGHRALSGGCSRRGSLPDGNRNDAATDRGGPAAALDPSTDGCPDRRPTDPFFYPTTIKPLTGLGFSLIEQTTPPKKPGIDAAANAGSPWDIPPTRDPACAPLFVPAPLGPYVDQPDEMQVLQQQNNSLARHIQELEHAKSLAAAQSTQALHRKRARQEHLKREAAQAVRRAKEMQEDLGPMPNSTQIYLSGMQAPEAPWDDGPWLGSGEADVAAPELQQGHLEPAWPSALAAKTATGAAGPSASERRSSGAGLRVAAEPRRIGPAADSQPCNGEAWRSSLPSTARGLDQSHVSEDSASDAFATMDVPSRRPPPQPRSGGERAAAFPPLPGLDGLHTDNSAGQAPTRRLLGEGTDGCGGLLPARTAQQAEAWAPLPASDVPSMDISTMASRILTSHQAPGHGPVSLLPDGQPYVDALGNPLGPISGPDLPNIKDDPLPAAPLAELRGGSDVLSVSGERCSTVGAGTHSMIGSFQPESAEANLQHELMPAQGSASARSTSVSHERVAPHAAAHDSMHVPPPGSYVASGSTVQQQEQHLAHLPDALPGTSAWSGLAASGGFSRGDDGTTDSMGHSGTPHIQAARPLPEPSVEVAVTPSSLTTQTAGEGGQRAVRRPEMKEAPAPKQGRRRVGEEATAQAGKRHQSEQSEQLQAELEECLDTIKWCASSVTRESLQDVKHISKPAPVIREVLETVALILGQPETRWDRLKKLITAKDFPEKIQKLNFQQSVTREQFRKLRERLGHHEFDEELIKTVSVPMVPLATWCRAIGVHLSRTRFKGGPEVRPLAAAGAAAPPEPERPQPEAPMTFEPDLAALGPQELRRVRDLTISRAGVGQIAFPGETDCTGLDFERIVRLEVGEVLVYPESGVKPPVGQGLNRPATVTMYQCYPPSRGKLLQDPGAQERYRRKIKKMTEEKEAQFIDYDCITGVWKFSVDHF